MYVSMFYINNFEEGSEYRISKFVDEMKMEGRAVMRPFVLCNGTWVVRVMTWQIRV